MSDRKEHAELLCLIEREVIQPLLGTEFNLKSSSVLQSHKSFGRLHAEIIMPLNAWYTDLARVRANILRTGESGLQPDELKQSADIAKLLNAFRNLIGLLMRICGGPKKITEQLERPYPIQSTEDMHRLARMICDQLGVIREGTGIAESTDEDRGQNSGQPDKKTDNQKKSATKTEPPDDVMRAAKAIRTARKEADRRGDQWPTKKDVLLQFASGDKELAAALGKQLQPSRYGYLLNGRPDN